MMNMTCIVSFHSFGNTRYRDLRTNSNSGLSGDRRGSTSVPTTPHVLPDLPTEVSEGTSVPEKRDLSSYVSEVGHRWVYKVGIVGNPSLSLSAFVTTTSDYETDTDTQLNPETLYSLSGVGDPSSCPSPSTLPRSYHLLCDVRGRGTVPPYLSPFPSS